MPRWLVIAVAVLIVGLGASAGTAVRLVHERDVARASAADLRTRLAGKIYELDISDSLLTRYRMLSSRGHETIDALHTQVAWDKSHLLDCWTVIVRSIDRPRLREIFGGSIGYLAHAARHGATVAHFTRRCAADAVP